ncbi:MAG TPA: hypothetical protein VGG60_16700 [Candidatus Binataceae bacterium]|jgi:hypothetical protein
MATTHHGPCPIRQYWRFAISVAMVAGCTLATCGCAIAPAPLKDTPHVVATPVNGQLTVSSEPSKPIGDVLPIYVSIANGTDSPRAIVPSQIFALNDAGSRIAPLPPAEAARQAGGAGELRAGLLSAGASGAVAGALGAGIGAIAGSLIHSGGSGAAIGGAIGTGTGAFHGATAGPAKANEQARTQLTALALRAEDVRQDFTVSGYVFFPKGDYKRIQMLLVDDETGNTEVISQPIM